MRIAVENFKGELPRVTPRLLPDGFAVEAVNSRLLSGDLDTWRNFELIEHLCKTGTINTIYPLHDPADALLIYWLHWADDELDFGAVEVDVAKSTLAGDTTARVYLTGLDVPRWTNKSLATDGSGCLPIRTRPLGVINPDNPPTLTVVGGGGTSSIVFTDEFDDPSLWTLSGDFNNGVTVRHAEINANGNPGNCLEVLAQESNDCAYGYRDTGAGGALTTQLRFQVFCDEPATTGVWNWMSGVYRDQAGEGIIVGMAFSVGQLFIGTTTEWADLIGTTIYGSSIGAQPPTDTWIQVTISIQREQNGLCAVTAIMSSVDGSTVYATANATDVPSAGGFIGFGNNCAPGIGGERVRFDNVQFQGQNIPDDTSDDRSTSYVYTFVADNEDGTFIESGPSPASVTVTRDAATIVTVTTDTTTPSGFDYNVVAKRIYRAVTGATGTLFYLLAEIPLAQADYVDTTPDATAAQGTVLPTEGFALPPQNMRGILALPNDIYAGFHDNVLDLSAQGFPHAWPVSFRLATDFPIVGIGAIDTMVVICTEGFPYIAAGNTPDAYSMGKIEFPQACVAKRGICYVSGIGVCYPSPDGYVAVSGPGRAVLITDQIFTRKEWQALRPSSMIATAHDNRIFVQYENDDGKGAFIIEASPNGFGKATLGFHATAVRSDLITDKLYLVLDENNPPAPVGSPATGQVVPDGGTIYAFDSYEGGSPTLTPKLPQSWLSKLYLLKKPRTFRYARVEADDYDDVTFVLIDAGQTFFSKEVTSSEEFVLPDVAGKRGAEDLQVQIVGSSTVRNWQIMESIDEIQ